MTIKPPAGPKGGMRTLEGMRIQQLAKNKGLQLRGLAKSVGLSPQAFSDMLAGRKSISSPTYVRLSAELGCDVADLRGVGVLTRWEGVQNRFFNALGECVNKPWYFFDNSEWPALLSESNLIGAFQCIDVLLAEIRAFKLSVDHRGISDLLDKVITFVERAHRSQIPGAGQPLFDLCDRQVHCYCYWMPPHILRPKVNGYLALMRLRFEETHDLALWRRLSFREADVLKICSEVDSAALHQSDKLLRQGHHTVRGSNRYRMGYHSIRSRVIVGAKTAETRREFMKILAMAERALESDSLIPDERQHLLDGMAEACAYRLSKEPKNYEYCKKALEYHERARLPDRQTEITEITLRLKKQVLYFADCGITDLVHSDGRETEEAKRETQFARNLRAAMQTDTLVQSLRRKGIIK